MGRPLAGATAPLLVCVLAAACGGGGTFPLELEVKDGAAIAGKRADELEIVVKTLPGVELRFEDQTRNVGDKAIETFTVQKSSLKLGKNVFNATATRGVLFSKEQAKAQVTWDAPARAFVRFHPTGADGGGGNVSCGGAMCGAPSFKVGKDGKIRIEAESALAGWLTIAGRRESVGNRQRKTFEVDIASALGGVLLSQRDALPLPVLLEIGSEKANEILVLQGPAILDAMTAALARVAAGPVTLPDESAAPPGDPRSVAVLGLPSNKLLVVGKATKVEDFDLVAVAKPAERFFSCSGSGSSASGILYLDLEVTVFQRRTGKQVHTRKLMADRVACPTGESKSPLPGANASRQAKAEVREADVSRALSELLGGESRAAAPPAKK